jgi:hypothetical protein
LRFFSVVVVCVVLVEDGAGVPSGLRAGVCSVFVVVVAEFSVVVEVGFAGAGVVTTTGAEDAGVGAVCWQAAAIRDARVSVPAVRNRRVIVFMVEVSHSPRSKSV